MADETAIKPLELLLKCSVISPYINVDRSFSVIIIADSQLYKTGSLMKFSDVRGITVQTDITYRDFVNEVLSDIQRGKYNTIIIPDLLKAIRKKQSTKENFLTLMNALIEEGVYKVYSGKDFEGARANLLTSITPDVWKDNRKGWHKIGFMNRLIPFTFEYTDERSKAVYEAIGKYAIDRNEKIEVNLPLINKIDVEIQKKYTDFAEECSKNTAKSEGYFRYYRQKDGELNAKFFGEKHAFRHKWHFQTILKCLAVIRGDIKVNGEDIKTLEWMSKWINYDFNPL